MAGLSHLFGHAASRCITNLKLAWAAGNGDDEAVRTLLAAGANIHTGDEYPLLVAVGGFCSRSWDSATEAKRLNTIKALLEGGADVHARRDRALRIAVDGGRTEVVRMLLQAGADVHALNRWQLRRLARLYERDTIVQALTAPESQAPQRPAAAPSHDKT